MGIGILSRTLAQYMQVALRAMATLRVGKSTA
jgi:hypothetical protein